MTDFNLDHDEAIIFERNDVLWLKQNDEHEDVDNFVLTNKRLCCSYEKSNGLFKKSTMELCTWSLSDIKIIKGQAQVQQIAYGGILCFRIQFMQGTEYFTFYDKPKEAIPQWILEINDLLGTTAMVTPTEPQKRKRGLFARTRNSPKIVANTTPGPITMPSVEHIQTVTKDHTEDPQPQQFETEQPPASKVCTNCGNKLPSGTIFCPLCGFKVVSTKENVTAPSDPPAHPIPPDPPVEEKVNHIKKLPKVEQAHDTDEEKQSTGTYAQRQHEYAGKVLKCPNCGEILKSFTALCPACGYEINSTQIHPVLAKFIDSLEECDQLIADEEQSFVKENKQKKDGWSTWGKEIKILWVILNIYAGCIPLIIYLIYKTIYRKRTLLNPHVARKESLIENYQIPNEKEIILESLYFIESKINSLSDKVITPDNWRWMSLWNSKAEQIYGKACILLPNDQALERIHQNIEQKVSKGRKIVAAQRILILIAIVICMAWFLWRSLQ